MDNTYYDNMTNTVYDLDRSIDRCYEHIAESYTVQLDNDNGNKYRDKLFQLIRRKTKLIKNIIDMNGCFIDLSLRIQQEVLDMKIKSFTKYKRKVDKDYDNL